MVYTISKRACVRNVLILVLGLLWLLPLGAGAQSLPNITVCDDCSSDFQFSQAAFSATDLFPGQSEVVYVVNIATEETRVFRVTLIITGGFGDTSLDVNITEISGDPAVISDIAAATTFVKDFNDALIQDVRAEDLDLSFDSALDLIDTPDLPARGFRRELQEGLTERYRTFWQARALELSNVAGSFLDQFFSGNLLKTRFVNVVFEDGTKVRVNIIDSGGELESDVYTIVFVVDVESITADELNFVPLEADDFLSLIGTDMNNDLAQHFRDLAFRFGIPVLWPEDLGGECTTSMSCGIVDGETRCTVRVESCIN